MPIPPDSTLLVEIEDRRVQEGRFLRYEYGVVVVRVEGEEIGFDTRNLAVESHEPEAA